MTLVSLVKFDLIAIVFAESMVEFELGVCFSTLKNLRLAGFVPGAVSVIQRLLSRLSRQNLPVI